MKKLNKILCYFGFHRWEYTSETTRICSNCKRSEFLDLEADVNPWGNPLWLKSPK